MERVQIRRRFQLLSSLKFFLTEQIQSWCMREWKPRWFAERAVLGLISGIFFDMVVQVHTVKVAWFVNTVFQKSTVAILFANSKPWQAGMELGLIPFIDWVLQLGTSDDYPKEREMASFILIESCHYAHRETRISWHPISRIHSIVSSTSYRPSFNILPPTLAWAWSWRLSVRC